VLLSEVSQITYRNRKRAAILFYATVIIAGRNAAFSFETITYDSSDIWLEKEARGKCYDVR